MSFISGYVDGVVKSAQSRGRSHWATRNSLSTPITLLSAKVRIWSDSSLTEFRNAPVATFTAAAEVTHDLLDHATTGGHLPSVVTAGRVCVHLLNRTPVTLPFTSEKDFWVNRCTFSFSWNDAVLICCSAQANKSKTEMANVLEKALFLHLESKTWVKSWSRSQT